MTEPMHSVPNDTVDMLVSRLASATDVKATIVGILLATLESEQSLRTHLNAGLPAREVPALSSPSEAMAMGADGAYLESITVEGFRGIGESQTLKVDPGNGLTLITGRNGSGKSSFAEGAEALLLGESSRWTERSSDWKRGWRNLHHTTATVEAQFTVPGHSKPTVIRRTWAVGADVGQSQVEVQQHGQKIERPERLGWTRSLEVYRPFLSYNDLARLFDKPSELFDSISRLLLLDDLPAFEQRIVAARREADQEVKKLAPLRTRLDGVLERSEDPRVAQIRLALGAKKVSANLRVVDDIIAGSKEPGDVSLFRQLMAVADPAEQIFTLLAEVRLARQQRDALTFSDSVRNLGIADLLDRALKVQDHTQTAECPVCATPDVLTAAWRAEAGFRASALRSEAVSLQAARDAADRAEKRFLELTKPPASVELAAEGDIGGAANVLQIWRSLSGRLNGADDGMDEETVNGLGVALADLHEACGQRVAEAAVVWQPILEALVLWRNQVSPSTVAEGHVTQLKLAAEWLAKAGNDLRNERFAEIKQEVLGFWQQLRMSSSVELHDLGLTGKSTSRQLQVDVSVDEAKSVALSVVSQGELHALALSLFLPQTLRPQSPFRFLIVDDPVQAMDPVRVEGLARVLAEVSKSRQVIVFTHDERLSAAIRRLQIRATEIRIVRSARSAIRIETVMEPAEELLRRAERIAKDPRVSANIARRVVGGYLRMSLEAIASTRYVRERLEAGDSLDSIESELEHSSLVEVLAKARGCSPTELYGRMNRGPGSWSVDLVKALNNGSHGSLKAPLEGYVADSRRLVAAVRQW